MGKIKPSYKTLELEIEHLEKELHLANKAVEKELQLIREREGEKEILSRSTMDTMLEGCQVIGFDWRYLYINNSASIHNKRDKEELMGKRYMDMWPGIEQTHIFSLIKDCMENRNTHQLENKFEFPDKTIGWFDLSIQPVPEGVFILSIDITDKKLAEKELRDNQEKFKIVFESANVGKSITLMTGEINVNQAFCDMLGYTIQELKNKKWQELTPEEDIPKTNQKLEKLILGKEDSVRFIKRYIHKKGFIVWADISLVLHRDENQEPLFYISTIVNISEQKKIEEKLLKNKMLLEEMGRMAKVGGWEFDPVTGNGTWTDEVSRIHDLEPGVETNLQYGLSFYSGESLQKIENAIKHAIEKQEPYSLELELNTQKQKKWVRTMGTPIIENDKVVKIRGSFQDITERKLAEKALKQSEERLNQAQRIANIGDFTWNVNTGEVTWSESMYNILGYDKNDIIDFAKVNLEIHHPEDLELVTDWLNECVYSGNNILTPKEYRLFRKDKTMIYVRTMGVIDRKPEHPIIVFATVQDITERKLAELEIKKLNRELEQRVIERTKQLEKINKELKTFTYSVSHDLKAPLRGIDGYSRLLQETYSERLNEEAQLFIRNIREATIQMDQLIEDLLEYSRLERSSLCKVDIPVKSFILNLLKLFQTEIEQKDISFYLDFDEHIIHTDQNSLALALRNVIENSIKYTGRVKSPEIHIGLIEEKTTATLFIQDNGIGFNMEYHNKIFDIFHRLHRIEDYPGTGIGLALVAKAMDRIGGKVRAESEPGKGATFFLEIPEI